MAVEMYIKNIKLVAIYELVFERAKPELTIAS